MYAASHTSQSAPSCGPETLTYHLTWPELAHLREPSRLTPRRKYSRLPQAQAAPRGASSPRAPASWRAADRRVVLPPLSGASDYFSTCGRNGRKLKSHGEQAAQRLSTHRKQASERELPPRVGGKGGGRGQPAGNTGLRTTRWVCQGEQIFLWSPNNVGSRGFLALEILRGGELQVPACVFC